MNTALFLVNVKGSRQLLVKFFRDREEAIDLDFIVVTIPLRDTMRRASMEEMNTPSSVNMITMAGIGFLL